MGNNLEQLKSLYHREKMLFALNLGAMSVTFFLTAFFIYLIAFSQTAIRSLEEQAQLTIYFKDDFTEQNILALENRIKEDERVSNVNYISKQKAFEIFSQQNVDKPIILEALSPEILPASLEVKAKNIADLDVLTQEYKTIDGVEDVEFYREVIENFKKWSYITYIVGFVLVLMLILISIAVVISTIRTNINTKGKEIEIMKLVGASNEYVQSPLIFQGIFFGAMSALISNIIATLIIIPLSMYGIFPMFISLGFLFGIKIHIFLFAMGLNLVLILLGFLLGYFGSTTGIKKYLSY